MRKSLLILVVLAAMGALRLHAAELPTTEPSGGGEAFSNLQPSLAINFRMDLTGVFPSPFGSNSDAYTMGFIRMFGGNFGSATLNGPILPIASYPALYSLFGPAYGGDGESSFALPDLRGRAAMGYDGTTLGLGAVNGNATGTLLEANLPPHQHTLPNGTAKTRLVGAGAPLSNLQPSLNINYIVNVSGPYPGGSFPDGPFLGQVALYAGVSPPGGWLPAAGQLLSIAGNETLFSLFGTLHGGDGETTFGLPDLRGRIPVGIDSEPVGTISGSAEVVLTPDQMPLHAHDLSDSDAATATSGGTDQASNVQPSLALRYLVATAGLYPSGDHSFGEFTSLGEITLFAGSDSQIPEGWTPADGRLLRISDSPALFSLLGTQYGGDGEVLYALPDLAGRTAIGMQHRVGIKSGSTVLDLTVDNLPSHAHIVPLPALAPLTSVTLLGLAAFARRRGTQRTNRRHPGEHPAI